MITVRNMAGNTRTAGYYTILFNMEHGIKHELAGIHLSRERKRKYYLKSKKNENEKNLVGV